MKKLLVALLLVWAVAYIASFALPATMAPTGDGFTRGLNRVGTFFGWQIGACLLAVLIWMVGRSAALSRRMIWVTRLPAILAGALIVFVIGVILWANFGLRSSEPAYVPPNMETTAEPLDL